MMKYPNPLTALLTLCLLFTTAESHAAKLYKWVDADGNISYQDSPPPANAKLLKESTIEVSPPAVSEGQDSPVTVYTVENCAACVQLTGRLRELEVPFSEQSLMDRDVQSEIISASESLTAPTMKLGNQYYSGLSDDDLIKELQDAGYEPKQQQETSPIPEQAYSDEDEE